MKISKLVIKNIASLKGQHTIDFDGILHDLNLFAVTGPTGSGKSTILSCIGLALYGDHYKKGVIQTDLVTLGEQKGTVELFFNFEGKSYLARWESRILKKTGEPLKVPKTTRELFQVNDEELFLVDKNIEDIIKLNFDQFCKTIILNQGEFSRFLTSSFRERKDILEKLYNGDVLSLLGKHLKQEITEQESRKSNFLSELNGLMISSELNKDDLIKELTLIKNKASHYEVNLASFESFQEHLKDYIELESKKSLTSEKLDSISNSISKTRKLYNEGLKKSEEISDKLEKAQKELEIRRPELENCIILNESIKNKSNQVEQYTEQFKHSQERSEKLSYDISDQHNLQNSLQKQLENEKNKFILESRNLTEISSSIDKLIELLNFENFQKIESQKLEQIESGIKDYSIKRSKLKDIRNEIEANYKSRFNNEEITNLSKRVNFINSNISDSESKAIESTKFIEITKEKYGAAHKSLIELRKNIKVSDNNILKIQDLMKDISSITQSIDAIETKIKYYQLIESINSCRKKANEEHSCPVCNNELNIELPIEKSEFDSNQARKEFTELEEKLVTRKIDLKVLESSNLNLRKTNEKLRAQIIPLLDLFDYKKENLPEPAFFKALFEKFYNKEINSLNKRNEDIGTLKSNLLFIQNVENEYQSVQKQMKDIDLSIDDLIIKKDSTTKAIQKYKSDIDKYLLVIKDNYNITSNNINEILGLLQKEKDQIILYNRIVDKIKSQQELIIKSQNEISSLEQEQKKLKNSILMLKDELVTLKNTIKETIGENDPHDVLNQLHNSNNKLQEELKKSEQIFYQYKIQLKENESKYQSMQDQIKDIQLTQSNALTHMNTISGDYFIKSEDSDELTQKIISLVLKFSSEKEIDTTSLILFEKVNEQFLELLNQFKAVFKETTARAIELETLIEQMNKKQERVDLINKELSIINTELERKLNLYDLIGKDEFRNYVLSIVEKNLILQTNHELETLCNARYKLVHQSKRNQMSEFYVIDRLKDGLSRKVSTLSGGETFMVSLAMALALSELTRGQTEIDSFFIDEGFATLDNDSLEDVIDVLNNMRSRGKQIGIISHLKNLTERIPVNIQLSKSQLGSSTIDVSYN
jgi:exonuclease SbcC